MDLKKVSEKTRELPIDFGDGDVLTVAYRPNALLVQDVLAEAEASTIEGAVERIVRVIARWDLTDEGQPVPITAERLATLPINLLLRVLTAAAEDVTPGEAKS